MPLYEWTARARSREDFEDGPPWQKYKHEMEVRRDEDHDERENHLIDKMAHADAMHIADRLGLDPDTVQILEIVMVDGGRSIWMAQ